MKKVIMGIGTAGIGKTTALKPFAQMYDYIYISPDDIRAELTGSASNQESNQKVWEEVHTRMKEALVRDKTVVVDATFARQHERIAFIRKAREFGAEKVQGVLAAVPLEIAQERNAARERIVPSHAVTRMHDMLQENPPAIEDGFDAVFDINEFQELQRAEKEVHNEIKVRTKLS